MAKACESKAFYHSPPLQCSLFAFDLCFAFNRILRDKEYLPRHQVKPPNEMMESGNRPRLALKLIKGATVIKMHMRYKGCEIDW